MGITLAVAASAYGIDPNRAMSQYIHDRWGPEQGFPRGPVYAITQSADGYLWVGTEAGLVRFDGSHFQLVGADSTAFRIAGVLGLTSDREGNLWVRLHGPRMIQYRDGAFADPMARLPYSNITAMCRTSDGSLLASATEQGTIAYRQGRFELLAAPTALPRSPVISIAQTSNGEVWMGTRGGGLFRMVSGHARPVTAGLPDPKINCLLPGPGGDLWVGTDMGVVRWNGVALQPIDLGTTGRRLQALAMVRDRDSNLWVGTDTRGLLRVNHHGVSSLNSAVAAGATEAITAAFEDREGALWFGSASGIERFRDSPFVTYSPSEGLPTEGSHPIYVDPENRVWFPPVDGGLWWMENERHGHVTEGGLDKDVIYSIAGRKGELWLGRQRGGLTQLRSTGGTVAATTYTRADGLAQNSVYSVYQTRDGAVWAGTLSGGVSRLHRGRFTTYTKANGLGSNTVVSIAEDAGGAMWFATPTGLSTLADGRWRTYAASDGLPSINVNCLLPDSGGTLWVGTADGLALRTPTGFRLPVNVPALLREQIFGIAEDRLGWLWIATANHILRVRRDKLMDGVLTDGDLNEYGHADGLRGSEGVKRHHSVVADPLGRIWFSTNRGISVVDPARISGSSVRANVHIQTISADGSSIAPGDPARIPAGSRRLAFGYSGLILSLPERVRFRYRLDGFDQNWSEPVASREAVYTNLNPATYRFRVVASSPDGVWNGTEATMGFVIAPLFWQTWWFRLGAVFAFGGAVFTAYRLRLRALAGQMNLRFEERLAERTRIAQELHDTLLQGFLSASMQLHVAGDRLPEDSPAKGSIARVLDLMSQVIEEGRNAVQGLRSGDHQSGDLAQAFSRVQQELAIGDGVSFRVIVVGQPQPIHPIIRDEVYRIGREALANAFRHARATEIELELEYTTRRLRLIARDNGRGIEQEILLAGRDGHWGLPGMRERAERIGAQLHVWSRGDTGTEVELSVPRHIVYRGQPSQNVHSWFTRWLPKKQTGSAASGRSGPAGNEREQ